MSIIDENQFKEDFQRAFKYSRFEEQKTFEEARVDAINAACALHGGSIHDHFERMDVALKDLCTSHQSLWGDDISAEDNRWFQHYQKLSKTPSSAP